MTSSGWSTRPTSGSCRAPGSASGGSPVPTRPRHRWARSRACGRSPWPASSPTTSISSCWPRSRRTTGCHRRRRWSRRRSATPGQRRWTSPRPAPGFVYAYSTAHAYIVSGMARHVLVIGSEALTRFLDYTDRNTCILFGDGAGAVVLSAADTPGGGLGFELTTEPSGAYMIWLPAGGAKAPATAETVAPRRALHPDGGQGDLPLRDAHPGQHGPGVDREGRPATVRHRPVHPAPGQHPDHRGRGQGPRPADGAGCS